MIKILILLAVMALPQVGGLSTVCNAGGRTGCGSNEDGSCALHSQCGSYSRRSYCTTVANPNWVPSTAAGKVNPRAGSDTKQFLCECR